MPLLSSRISEICAPEYCPEVWNDLPIDPKENVRLFFSELREKNMGIALLLQTSSLLYLSALVSLCDKRPTLENTNCSRIRSLLSLEEISKLEALVRKYFSFQQTRANCYAYALNFMEGGPGAKPDPGGKTQEYIHGKYRSYKDAIIDGAIEDGLIAAGVTLPKVRESFYRAALFIKEGVNDYSFHWLREDFREAHWSHKDGHGPVKDVDFKGSVIFTPNSASIGEYSFAQYFYVPHGALPQFCYSGL